MYTNYFAGCTTLEDIKKMYRQLAKQYHPDRNRDTDTTRIMQDINAQYHAALKAKDKTTSQDSQGKSHTYHYNETTEQMIMDMIKEVLSFGLPAHVDFFIVGTWLWVDGTRKEDKEFRAELNRLKFRWNRKRSCWQWSKPGGRRRNFASKSDSEELFKKYGRQAAAQAV